MTTVYYALGGGRGHRQRAIELATRAGTEAVILHQAGPISTPGRIRAVDLGVCTVAAARQALRDALVGARMLVVDTFPGGVAHELELPRDVRTTLIARALDRDAYPDYDALAARYDEVLIPYDPEDCEWDDAPAGRYIGPITRSVRVDGRCDLLVIGDGEPEGWTPLLRDAVRVRGAFDAIPRARRTVALSAGYNLAWELHGLGVRPALRPLPRRFDDQFRRAARLGTPLHHRRDLERYLDGDPCCC